MQGIYIHSFALFQCYTLSKNVVYKPFYWLGGGENILGLIGGLGEDGLQILVRPWDLSMKQGSLFLFHFVVLRSLKYHEVSHCTHSRYL
jgi:hypothetical protein